MKISVASPQTGTQKVFDIEEEKKLMPLFEKRVSNEFNADFLGEQFKGYILKITGGQDKQGFPMKQGVLTNTRVKLLLQRGELGFQRFRGRAGERRRKSVRGCIVGPDLAILHCIVAKEGDAKIEGLNDHVVPRRLGPKRASKIRRLFNLTKEDDVRKFVIRRVLPQKTTKSGKIKKARSVAPKIQRLITPVVLERKRRRQVRIRNRRLKGAEERETYHKMLHRRKQLKEQRKKSKKMNDMHVQRVKELKLKKKHAKDPARRHRRTLRKAALKVKTAAKSKAKPKAKAKAKAQAKPKAAAKKPAAKK